MGTRRLAPWGRDEGSSSWRSEGMGPASCRQDKGRAVSSTALAGCGRGRDGRVAGSGGTVTEASRECLGDAPTGAEGRFPNGQGSAAFPIRVYGGYRTPHIPTRPAWFEMVAIRPFRTTEIPDRSDSLPLATDPSPVGHGSVTEVGPRHGDVGNSTLPPVSSPTHAGAVVLRSGIRTKARPHALGASSPAPRATRGERACDVPGIFVTDRAGVWNNSDSDVTEVRHPPVHVTAPPRKPHVPGASWGSQPARTPMRRPGPASTHLGRPQAPGPPPVPPSAPRST